MTLSRNPDGTAELEVVIRITNPTNCTPDQPCPEYDSAPEYVHAWIDWNRNGVWEPSEQVPLDPLSIVDYRGSSMSVKTVFTVPSTATLEPTWMRVNLGWDNTGDPCADPCLQSWVWGNVLDQQVLPPARFSDFSAASPGSYRNLPQTGSSITLTATIEVAAGNSVTGCTWNQAGVQAQTAAVPDPADPRSWTCAYTYDSGAGPAGDATHGQKSVEVSALYVANGATSTISKRFDYSVFFARDGIESKAQTLPNWLRYWGDTGDRAVPGLTADIGFDPTVAGVGRYIAAGDTLLLGAGASGYRFPWLYPNALALAPVPHQCPGGTFPQASGIDTVAQVIGALSRKKARYHMLHDVSGAWHSLKDSDGDDLPDMYEARGLMTSPLMTDSCGLAQALGDSSLAATADAELDAIVAAKGLAGDPSHDWANPGKQADLLASPGGAGATSPPAEPGTLLLRSGPVESGSWGPSPVTPDVSLGRILGNYSDQAVDLDGDGLYDRLVVSLDVSVPVTGDYNVVGWLADSGGSPFAWASTSGRLTAGTHRIDLAFGATLLRRAATDGPYALSRVELRAGPWEVAADAATLPYFTAAYQRSAADPAPIAFTGAVSSVALDTQGDGFYDLLRFQLGLSVRAPGTYTVRAELAAGRLIQAAHATASLSPGNQTVNLDFDGRAIFRNREDGPYTLRSIRIEDASGVLQDNLAGTYATQAYRYSYFQEASPCFLTNSYALSGLDVDGDGVLDYLRVAFHVQCSTPGSYLVQMALLDKIGAAVSTLEKKADLLSGQNALVFDFPGGDIRSHGVNGPWHVGAVAVVAPDGTLADAQPYAIDTPAYQASQFAPPLVQLSGGYSDAGNDTNGDGRYESLDVGVGVVPARDGIVVVRGRLLDQGGVEIGWAETSAEGKKGTLGRLTLSFPGGLISGSGRDGPCRLSSLLVYHTSDPSQSLYASDVYVTAPYRSTDF